MENRYQEDIDRCNEQIANCGKQIRNIGRQNKFAMILIAFNAVVAVACLFMASYGLALFLCIVSVLNYVINDAVQRLIPKYEGYIKGYKETIATYEKLELDQRDLDDVKRRIAKLKEPVSQVLSN